MWKNLLRSSLFVLCTVAGFAQSPRTDLKLWYNEPAKGWTEALPVGNGRLGAMVFGRVHEELIQLNEATLWSGGPADLNPNPEAPKYLPQVREALFKGDYQTAQERCRKLQGRYPPQHQRHQSQSTLRRQGG